MRKFILGTLLATAMTSASAGGYSHYHHGHRHHHNNGNVVLGIIGGAIIAQAIANQQRQIVVQQPIITSVIPQPMVTQSNCLVNIYNPYMQRYENVVVTCIQQ